MMALTEERLRELAAKLADRIRDVEEQGKPRLRLVSLNETQERSRRLDAITREAHCRMIRYMARAYGLQWLVDQATQVAAGIESLPDDELIKLRRDMDLARECPEYDVSYQERGLVRSFSEG